MWACSSMLMLGCCDVWLYHRNFPLTHIGYYTLHETELGRAEKRRRRGDADSAIMLVLCSPLLCRNNVTQVTLFPHKTPPKLQASLSLEPLTTLFGSKLVSLYWSALERVAWKGPYKGLYGIPTISKDAVPYKDTISSSAGPMQPQ